MTVAKILGESLRHQGVSRRGFLKFCVATATLMALPPRVVPVMAAALEKAGRPSVIWLSFGDFSVRSPTLPVGSAQFPAGSRAEDRSDPFSG